MAKNKNIFVTITGFQHYYGREPFQIGNLIRCAKEPGNPYDSDAIRAFLPYIGKVGYIANSPQTKYICNRITNEKTGERRKKRMITIREMQIDDLEQVMPIS